MRGGDYVRDALLLKQRRDASAPLAVKVYVKHGGVDYFGVDPHDCLLYRARVNHPVTEMRESRAYARGELRIVFYH